MNGSRKDSERRGKGREQYGKKKSEGEIIEAKEGERKGEDGKKMGTRKDGGGRIIVEDESKDKNKEN